MKTLNRAHVCLLSLLLFFISSCNDFKWNNILDSNNDLPTVAMPVLNPPGNTYEIAQTVTITSATPNALITYTLDGSEPSQTSNPYLAPVFVPEDLNLKAKAFREGYNPSPVSSGSYVITTPTCANPLLSPPADSYSTPQNVVLTCTTPGAQIRYTTDGSDPSQVSALYSTPISVATNATIKARAFKTGYTPSQIVAAVYEIIVAAPILDPPGGDYSSPLNVSVSCPTPGAEIKYTLDGSEPSNSSTPYSQPVYIPSDKTLKAKAFKNGCTPSATTTGEYGISFTVANPTFSPDPSVAYPTPQSVTISCATSGASIYYTTNGNTPSQASTLYTGAIDISEHTMFKAIAYKSGWQPSQVVSAGYTFNLTVPTPTFDPPGGGYTTEQQVTISCAKPGATIRYTLNGSEPNSASPVYTGPVTISQNRTLKAKAYYTGWNASNTATAVYVIGLYYDFEGWNGNFFSQSGWQYGTPDQVTPHSGSSTWAMSLSGNYPQGAQFTLLSPYWTLGNNALLSFWHIYYFATFSDYGNWAATFSDAGMVFISNDAGQNWTQLTSIQGNSDFQWTQNTWSYLSYDLSDYASDTVRIKYVVNGNSTHYNTAPNVGWFIDDIQITNATEARKGKRPK